MLSQQFFSSHLSWPFSVGFDITILSTLWFLFCLVCWDHYPCPSLERNADTKGSVLSRSSHYPFWQFEEAMDLYLTKVTCNILGNFRIFGFQVKNSCSKFSGQRHQFKAFNYVLISPKILYATQYSYSLLDVQQVFKSIYPHGTCHCPSQTDYFPIKRNLIHLPSYTSCKPGGQSRSSIQSTIKCL